MNFQYLTTKYSSFIASLPSSLPQSTYSWMGDESSQKLSTQITVYAVQRGYFGYMRMLCEQRVPGDLQEVGTSKCINLMNECINIMVKPKLLSEVGSF